MKSIQLNKNWKAKQGEANFKYELAEDTLSLVFLLESEDHEHVDENEQGVLNFENTHMYCIETMGDEVSLHEKYGFKNTEIVCGSFYEFKNSGLDKSFPANSIVVRKPVKKSKLRHFAMFLNDKIIECLAEDFNFSFNDTVSIVLDEKYPKGYFSYYLSMFSSQFETPSEANYKLFTNLYLQITGKDELKKLKAELSQIKKNNDLPSFLKLINYREISNFDMKQLFAMIKVIENFKL